MRIALCMHKTTNTRLLYVIHTALPLQQRLHECAHCYVIVCIVVVDGAKRHAESLSVAMCLRWPPRRQCLPLQPSICSNARPCACMGTRNSFLVSRDVIHKMLWLEMRRALLPRGMVLRRGSSVPMYDERFRSAKDHESAGVFLLKSNLGVDAKCDNGLMVLAEVYCARIPFTG